MTDPARALPSLITFNCASAYVYQRLDTPYLTPLIGHLFRSWQEYLRFLGDLPARLQLAPEFGEPRHPRYPLAGPDAYPVSFFGDVEIHWIHMLRPDQVIRRLEVGGKKFDWSQLAVTFCEANFGPKELTADEWVGFRSAWEALPYRKAFFSTGHYGPCDGEVRHARWRGFRHFEDICGEGFSCKPGCGGCGQTRWGQHSKEGIAILRWLDMEPAHDPDFRTTAPK